MSATGWAEVARSMDDRPSFTGISQRICFVPGWSAQMEAIWTEAKWMDGGKTAADEDEDAIYCRSPCCIY